MSKKQKRKQKQENSKSPVYIILSVSLVLFLFLLMLVAMIFTAQSNALQKRQIFELTATDLWFENTTRRAQIEASSTAAIINQTATVEANLTPTP